ncbi:hypothetical protein [Spiroplasma endosymbiont of Nebria brevicollis]|uniref:hypothetical protein n=1 Tax=Spiroplasma endosymbiont of Nebria brevicollis TaxID=3066284 RepID=UPI00313E908F
MTNIQLCHLLVLGIDDSLNLSFCQRSLPLVHSTLSVSWIKPFFSKKSFVLPVMYSYISWIGTFLFLKPS